MPPPLPLSPAPPQPAPPQMVAAVAVAAPAAPALPMPPLVTPQRQAAVALPVPAAPAFAPLSNHVRISRDEPLPDFMNGAARKRRALTIVLAIAILALAGTIAAAIASHFRPM